MSKGNLTLHEDMGRCYRRKVFCTETGALTKGYGVCYDRDYGTATDSDGLRDKRVALPTVTNNNAFAGVIAYDYSANANGQWIYIYEPGSVCDVYFDATTAIGETKYAWFLVGADAGKCSVTNTGYMGKGCVRVMQTRTGAGLAQAELMDGPESGLVNIVATATLTAGGAYTDMVGGVTVFTGPATPASDVTMTLADGTYIGQGKSYKLDGALTTNDVAITVTSGEQLDGSTDLATLELDGDNDNSTLIFGGHGADTGTWRLLHNAGTGLA